MSFLPSLDAPALSEYLARQLNHFFPDPRRVTAKALLSRVSAALEQIQFCFSHIQLAYYFDGVSVRFDHLNGDHYAKFLYFASNQLYRAGSLDLATKVFLLNKALHGLDLFYSVRMPPVFLLVHPVGTVLGKADYGNFLVVYQNVTVGATDRGIYPVIGEKTILYSKATLLGQCQVGDEVVFASNSFLINTDVPPRSVVTGAYPGFRIKPNDSRIINSIYRL